MIPEGVLEATIKNTEIFLRFLIDIREAQDKGQDILDDPKVRTVLSRKRKQIRKQMTSIRFVGNGHQPPQPDG